MKTIPFVDAEQKAFLLNLCEQIPDGTVAALSLALDTRAEVLRQADAVCASQQWQVSDAGFAALVAACRTLPGVANVLSLLAHSGGDQT